MQRALSIVAAAAFWCSTGTTLATGPHRLERSDEAMGASFSVVLHGPDAAALDSAADAALNEARRLDALLSNYRPTSEWSIVNREAGLHPVRLSDELFRLLQRCLEYSRRSEGAFDITVAPLVKTWGFYMGEGAMPQAAEVAAALARVGYAHVELDTDARTVRFLRRGVEIDPGGIGKGYAVDRMVDVLKRRGIHRALVSAAGSSIYGLGAPPDDPRGWPITIRAPRNPGRSVAQVFLRDLSMSTSGGYEKFFWADGRTYSHILDPRSGYPAQGAESVSVLAPNAIDSEAWTKPFFVNGAEWTRAHTPDGFRVFFCGAGADGTCTWVQ